MGMQIQKINVRSDEKANSVVSGHEKHCLLAMLIWTLRSKCHKTIHKKIPERKKYIILKTLSAYSGSQTELVSAVVQKQPSYEVQRFVFF